MFVLTETYDRAQQYSNNTAFTILLAVCGAFVLLAFLYLIFSFFFLDKVKRWWYNKTTKRKRRKGDKLMDNLILNYIHVHPGCRKREIASGIDIWLCDAHFLNAMSYLEKSGKIYSVAHNDPANMEFYDKWYIKED